MRLRGIDAIEFAINYKDGGNNFYTTNCRIDVMKDGGLAVRFISQDMLGNNGISNSTAHPEIILSAEWPDERKPDLHRMRFVEPLNQGIERPFVLSNHSEVVAYNVKIRDITRNGKTATFPEIGFVRKGEDQPALPKVLNEDIFASKSLRPLFANDAAQVLDITVSLVTDYRDARGQKWETEQEMTYDRFWKTPSFRLVYCGPRRIEENESRIQRRTGSRG
jgi:hypothetical protein